MQYPPFSVSRSEVPYLSRRPTASISSRPISPPTDPAEHHPTCPSLPSCLNSCSSPSPCPSRRADTKYRAHLLVRLFRHGRPETLEHLAQLRHGRRERLRIVFEPLEQCGIRFACKIGRKVECLDVRV